MRTVLVALVLLAPVALAQSHAHLAGEGAAIALHDGPKDGHAVVGAFTHFGFQLLDEDGAPAVHRNAEFSLAQDGVVLFTTNDTHEYDGHFSFDVTFTKPGPFVVTATSEGMTSVVFEGVASARQNEFQPTLDLKLETLPDNAVKATIALLDEAGALVPHTDALVEFREKGSLQLLRRVHAHIHTEPIELVQSFGLPGDVVMRVVGYNADPSPGARDFRAVVAEAPISVRPLVGAAPPALGAVPQLLAPLGAKAEADGYTLYALYDPQNQVGAGGMARVSGLILDADKMPLQHVDFEMRLQGPTGLVFASKSLHEYDGVFEYQFVPAVPGTYDGALTALVGDTTLTVPLQLQALPDVTPLTRSPGPATVTVEGLDAVTAGAPVELTFSVDGPAGPVQHSEVDVTIHHEGEAPVQKFKLHTHGSGKTKASVVFPHEGDWVVSVDPLSTTPDPVVFQGPAGAGAPIEFAATVAAADVVEPVASEKPAAKLAPGAGLALAVAGLAVAAAAWTARRR